MSIRLPDIEKMRGTLEEWQEQINNDRQRYGLPLLSPEQVMCYVVEMVDRQIPCFIAGTLVQK